MHIQYIHANTERLSCLTFNPIRLGSIASLKIKVRASFTLSSHLRKLIDGKPNWDQIKNDTTQNITKYMTFITKANK